MFSTREQEMIEFGKFTVYQSLKEMIDQKENLNNIAFDELAEATIRDIDDGVLLETIEAIQSGKCDTLQDWREGLN